MEEYTGPIGCDYCEFEKETPCPGKNCNSATGLKGFKPKGLKKEDTGCPTCPHWKAVKIGKFCPDCGEKL